MLLLIEKGISCWMCHRPRLNGTYGNLAYRRASGLRPGNAGQPAEFDVFSGSTWRLPFQVVLSIVDNLNVCRARVPNKLHANVGVLRPSFVQQARS